MWGGTGYFTPGKAVRPVAESEEPPLEDWLELLDAVQRRINRRLLRPEEEDRVKASIRERFPDAQIG
jgi:hypothetical protein